MALLLKPVLHAATSAEAIKSVHLPACKAAAQPDVLAALCTTVAPAEASISKTPGCSDLVCQLAQQLVVHLWQHDSTQQHGSQ